MASSKLLLPKECIFCRKIYIYRNKKKLKANKIGSVAAREATKKAQLSKQNTHIAHLLNNYDLTSAEAHYHHSCYADFTRDESRHERPAKKDAVDDNVQELQDEILSKLREKFVQNEKILTMDEMFNMLKRGEIRTVHVWLI